MAFCKNCGAEIDDNAVVCPSCGVAQEKVTEGSKVGYGILGCCIPLVGLILFLVWKDTKPETSKAAGIGALVGVIINALGGLFYFMFLGSMMAGMSMY